MIVEPTSDDTVSLVFWTNKVTVEPIEDVEFEWSNVVEEFATDMVAEYDG